MGFRISGFLLAAIVQLAFASPLAAADRGSEVVVLYNKRVPESKSVAEHYAQCRNVPAGQVLGLSLPTTEDVSRAVFRDELQKPLARWIADTKLWRMGSAPLPSTNGQRGALVRRPLESKIRYLVLCYGVPLRIQAEANMKEDGMDAVRPELRRNEAAVDSELACLPMIEAKLPLFGPVMNPFYTTTNAAALNPTNGILLVARLDGPTAQIAQGLVDKAIQAETNGLWGRAYFDVRGVTDAGYKIGDDWILAASEIARVCGFETTVETNAGTFSAAFPMSHVALYAGWYDEHVSGPFAQPTVEFMPGAFAYHLHSFSAMTMRSTTQRWTGPLVAKGATATMGSVWEPYLTGTPDMGIFFARFLMQGLSFGEAAYASSITLSWQTTVVGDPLYRPFGKEHSALRNELDRRRDPMSAWAQLQLVNFKLAQKTPLVEAQAFLESNEAARRSAILMEKLGDLCSRQGKPSSAVWAYEQALKLDASPQQRIRLMLTLAERLVASGREADADQLYEQFLKDFPKYPDRLSVEQKALALARKLNRADAANHEQEVQRLTAPPANSASTNASK